MSEAGSTRILIVDDEPQILRFLGTSLVAHGYSILESPTGEEAVLRAEIDRPDLVILDLGLPDIDGMEVLRRVRSHSSVPVIILSAREREADKVLALDNGADDYVTKPFGVGELMARVRSTLRRRSVEFESITFYRHGSLSVDMERRRVMLDGEELKLTPKEYEILSMLASNAGRVVTHQNLLREIWGPTYTSETHYLRVYVGQLRHKLEEDPAQPRYIQTEPGVGYRMPEMEEME